MKLYMAALLAISFLDIFNEGIVRGMFSIQIKYPICYFQVQIKPEACIFLLHICLHVAPSSDGRDPSARGKCLGPETSFKLEQNSQRINPDKPDFIFFAQSIVSGSNLHVMFLHVCATDVSYEFSTGNFPSVWGPNGDWDHSTLLPSHHNIFLDQK